MNRTLTAPTALMVLLTACGGDSPSGADGGEMDASTDAAALELCARAADCDDGQYCNGMERCEPGGDGADARGCIAGVTPCDPSTETCDEAADACAADECTDGGDADGDGDPRVACGGADCDDDEATVYSTAQERCDGAGVDEDCDPATIHNDSPGVNDGDRDGDGYVSVLCFNRRPDGGENRGTDCDDGRAAINPMASEICNGDDDNCNGSVDEDVEETYYRDVDGDGYGDAAMMTSGCSAPDGWVLLDTDCDDRSRSINPGVSDACNGVDDDCSGTIDDPPMGCACSDGAERPCGPPMRLAGVGICRRSTQSCVAGRWPAECPGAVYPNASDPCGNGDEDCDGMLDEDGWVAHYRDADSDGYGDRTMRMDACPGTAGAGWVEDDRDCDEGRADIHPGATETCDGVDNDCSGTIDDVPGGCGCLEGEVSVCSSNVGECREGMATCTAAGTWGACFGGVVAEAESCNHLDDDCDGSRDDGVGLSAACSRTFTGGTTWERRPPVGPFGTPNDLSMPSYCTASACGGDEPPAAVYVTSWPLDWGRANVFRGRFQVSDRTPSNTTAPEGVYTLVVSPNTTLGSATGSCSLYGCTRDGLPPLTGSQRAAAVQAHMYQPTSGSPSPGMLTILTGDAAGWTVRGAVLLASDCSLPMGCSTAGCAARDYTVELVQETSSLTARISGTGCTARSVTYDAASTLGGADADGIWRAMYGETASYPTYYVGAVGKANREMYLQVSELYVERRSRSGDRNNCVGCM